MGSEFNNMGLNMFSMIFYCGCFSSAYLMFTLSRSTCKYAFDYLRSYFNPRKYLKSAEDDPLLQPMQYYAVIYGASNKAGKAFAHYLAEKGFGLILIDRDIRPLKKLEQVILSNKDRQVDVIKIELSRFDSLTVDQKIAPVINYPVKLFINCKNSKRAKAPQNNDDTHQTSVTKEEAEENEEDLAMYK